VDNIPQAAHGASSAPPSAFAVPEPSGDSCIQRNRIFV
jgi:hypothetical protein